MAVGGVGDVPRAGPGAPGDRVRGGGVVGDPSPHTGAGGAVALALVAGAGLPRSAQGRAVLGERVMAQTAPGLVRVRSV